MSYLLCVYLPAAVHKPGKTFFSRQVLTRDVVGSWAEAKRQARSELTFGGANYVEIYAYHGTTLRREWNGWSDAYDRN